MPEEMPNSSKENFELARINWLITIMKFPNLPSSQKCPPSRKFWLNKALSLTFVILQLMQALSKNGWFHFKAS